MPFYRAMFGRAGFADVDGGYSDELLDDLVVSGTESEVADRLASLVRDDGFGEVLAMPVLDPQDREGSLTRAFAAVAGANRSLS